MRKLKYNPQFDESFARIEHSLFRYWNSIDPAKELFRIIYDQGLALLENPQRYRKIYEDKRRFIITYRGITYTILYKYDNVCVYFLDIVYSKSDYLKTLQRLN